MPKGGGLTRGNYAFALAAVPVGLALFSSCKAFHLASFGNRRRGERWSLYACRLLLRTLLRCSFWLTIEDEPSEADWDALIPDESCVVIINHASQFDGFFFGAMASRNVMARAKSLMIAKAFKMPLAGTIFKCLGHQPVHFLRDEAGKFSVDKEKQAPVNAKIRRAAAGGGVLTFCPEGQINRRIDEGRRRAKPAKARERVAEALERRRVVVADARRVRAVEAREFDDGHGAAPRACGAVERASEENKGGAAAAQRVVVVEAREGPGRVEARDLDVRHGVGHDAASSSSRKAAKASKSSGRNLGATTKAMPADASAADAAARRDAAKTSAANAPGASASETANLHAAGVSSDFFAQGQSFTSAIHRHQRSVAATAPAAASRSGGAASAAMAHGDEPSHSP
ncbi:acyltransferase [Aureococcus anophagefferens]|nr:acyltransferase [Aureococcus anophagefferens]